MCRIAVVDNLTYVICSSVVIDNIAVISIDR